MGSAAQASEPQTEPTPSWTVRSHPPEREEPTSELPPAWLGEGKYRSKGGVCRHLHRILASSQKADTSLLPGPRNWHPRARTAAHRLEESCCGFWCCKMSSVTVRSPRERAALMARTRPSSSTSWQWTSVTSFLCMGRLSMLWAVLLRPTPGERLDRTGSEQVVNRGNMNSDIINPHWPVY